MKHLVELNFLIDAASAIAGNDSQLAKALGVHRSLVSNWRKGNAACSPENQVLMAGIAGFDPQQTAARALVEKHEGTPLGDKLMRVLGKPLRVTGAALGFAGAAALATFSMIPGSSHAGAVLGNVYRRARRYVKRSEAPRSSGSVHK